MASHFSMDNGSHWIGIQLFALVLWPSSQELLDLPEFESNSILVNEPEDLEKYGPSAFLVNLEWLKKHTKVQLTL